MTDVVTVSGSDGYTGPLPVVQDVAEERGLDVTPVTFAGDAADEYAGCLSTVREAIETGGPVLLAGFSAGAHLALHLVQDRPSLIPPESVVLAFDPPDPMQTGNGTVPISPVAAVPPDCVAVYPSIREEGDRVSGDCRIREVSYDPFTYAEEDPSDQQYSRMDRAHRFQNREDAVRALVEEELAAVSPRQGRDGTLSAPDV